MEGIFKLTEIIPILIFLLPGFLTAKMIDLWVVTKSKDVFDKIVQAVVFTFINLFCFFCLRWLIERKLHIQFDHAQFYTVKNLLLMVFCAFAIALACAFEMNKEILLSLLRKLGITKKTYKPCTWVETFESAPKFVVVHLDDGRRIYGWPRFYADDPDERAIFLEEASWMDANNNLINNPPISILLDEKSGIQLVEFLQ